MMSKRDHQYELAEVLNFLKAFDASKFDSLSADSVVDTAKYLEQALAVLNHRIENEPLNKDLEDLIDAVRKVLGFDEADLEASIMRHLFRTLKINSAEEVVNENGVSVTIEWSIYGVPFTFFADLMINEGKSNGTIDLFPFMCSYVQDVSDDEPFTFEPLDSELQPLFDRFAHMCFLHDADANAWIVAVKLVGNALVYLLKKNDVEYFGKPLSETVAAERIILAFNHVVEVYEPEEFTDNDNGGIVIDEDGDDDEAEFEDEE